MQEELLLHVTSTLLVEVDNLLRASNIVLQFVIQPLLLLTQTYISFTSSSLLLQISLLIHNPIVKSMQYNPTSQVMRKLVFPFAY